MYSEDLCGATDRIHSIRVPTSGGGLSDTAMPVLAMQMFERLELFIRNCPDYSPTLWNKGLVLASYNAFYVYVFLLVVAVYDRSMFHVMAWFGVFCTEVFVTLAATQMPIVNTPQTLCDPHPQEAPSRAMAIVVYVTSFYLIYNLQRGSHRIFVNAVGFAWLVIFSLSSAASLLLLHLNTLQEVLIGSLIGALSGALIAGVCLVILLPRFSDPSMNTVKGLLMVHRNKFRT